jgi:hypothetical protein
MRRFRVFLTLLLALLLMFDGVTAFRVWWYGLQSVSITDGRVAVESVPFSATDSLILLVLAGLHGVLVFAVWKAWRSTPIRV